MVGTAAVAAAAAAAAPDLIDLTQYEEGGGHSNGGFAPAPPASTQPRGATTGASQAQAAMERLLGLDKEGATTTDYSDSSLQERKQHHYRLLPSPSSSSSSDTLPMGHRSSPLRRREDQRLSLAVQSSRLMQQGSRLAQQGQFHRVFEEEAAAELSPSPNPQPIFATPSLEEELHQGRSRRSPRNNDKEGHRGLSPNPIEISPSLETEYLTKEQHQQQQIRLQYSSSPNPQRPDRSSNFLRLTERVIEDRSRTQQSPRSPQGAPSRTIIDIESLQEREGTTEAPSPKPRAADAGSVGTFDATSREAASFSSSSMYRRAIQARQGKMLQAAPETTVVPAASTRRQTVAAAPFKPIPTVDTLGDEDSNSGSPFRANLREKYRKVAVSPAHSDYDGEEDRGTEAGAGEKNIVARFAATPFQGDILADPGIGYNQSGSAVRHGPGPIKPESPRVGSDRIVLQGAEVVHIDQETLAKYAIDVSRHEETVDETEDNSSTSESISEPRKRMNMASRSMIDDSDVLAQEIRAVKSMPTDHEKTYRMVDVAALTGRTGRFHSDRNTVIQNKSGTLMASDSDNKNEKATESYRTDLALGESSSSTIDSAPTMDRKWSTLSEHAKEMKLMELRASAVSPKSPEELYTRHHNVEDKADLDEGATSDEGESRTTTDASRTTDVSYDRREGATISSGENSEGKASILSIMQSDSSESDIGLHPELDPHLLYDSEAMHFVISMLDKSCAWLEDDSCTSCSFQPSSPLMKEIKRKRQEEARVRAGGWQQGHLTGRSPSFQSVKRVSSSPLVQKLQERSVRRTSRRQRRNDSDSHSAPLSPFARPRRDIHGSSALTMDASTQSSLSEDLSRTPKTRKHVKSQRSPRSNRPSPPQTYSADVSEGEQVYIASYRKPSLQIPTSNLDHTEPVKSPAVSPFQKKLQERLANVRGDAEILSATLSPTVHDDDSDIKNLNSSPSDPVDLVEYGYSHSNKDDENQPARNSETQTSPRSFLVSSQTRSVDAPPHDAANGVLLKSRSPRNRLYGSTKVLEEEDAVLEQRIGAVKLSSDNDHQQFQRARDPSPGGGMLWERRNASIDDMRDEQEERSESPVQYHPKLDPEPSRTPIERRGTVIRFRDDETAEDDPALAFESRKTDRVQLSRAKVIPESLGTSSRVHGFSAFQEEASAQDRSIRFTAGGPEVHRAKPVPRLVGGPLETIAETREEEEPPPRQLPEEPRPRQPLSPSSLTADEKHAALELAEKLRHRAHTLKTRRRARFFDGSLHNDSELVSSMMVKQDSVSASSVDGNLSVGTSEAALKGQ